MRRRLEHRRLARVYDRPVPAAGRARVQLRQEEHPGGAGRRPVAGDLATAVHVLGAPPRTLNIATAPGRWVTPLPSSRTRSNGPTERSTVPLSLAHDQRPGAGAAGRSRRALRSAVRRGRATSPPHPLPPPPVGEHAGRPVGSSRGRGRAGRPAALARQDYPHDEVTAERSGAPLILLSHNHRDGRRRDRAAVTPRTSTTTP